MAEWAAVDASPLILLARIDAFDLLRLAGDRIVVPAAVRDEIERRGADDPAVVAIRDASWLERAESVAVPNFISDWGLGPGETAVLAWAHTHRGAWAIIDDLPARRHAAEASIAVRGTVGLVLVAKQRGLIAAARPAIERLREVGLYLSDHVLAEALRRVDE